MQYRYDKEKNPVSMLAFGCMRFTKENGKINLEKAEAEILEAMKLGVNYFDSRTDKTCRIFLPFHTGRTGSNFKRTSGDGICTASD